MNRKDFLKAGLVMIGGVWVPKQQGATIIVRGPRQHAAGGATTLDDFSGLVAWYKPPISGATNGNAISSWPDSKGSYNLDNSGGSFTYPIYNTNDLNGLDTLSFNGTTAGLQTGGPSASDYPTSIVAVVNLTNTTDFHVIASGQTQGGINFRVNQTTGYLNVDKAQVAGIGTGNVAVTTGAWHTVMCVVTSTTYAFWIDGSTAGSGSHSVTLDSGELFGVGNDNTGGLPWIGKIAEVGIYNTDRSSDAASIHSALATKYGL